MNERKLNITRQSLQLCQLLVRLRQQRLLILLPPQSKQCFLLIPIPKTFLRDFRLAIRDRRDSFLVLLELVALNLQVEDGSECLLFSNDGSQGSYAVRQPSPVLIRDFILAARIAHFTQSYARVWVWR